MNVLICSHMYPNGARPQLGVFVREQVKWLARTHDVTVLSPVPWLPVDIHGTRFSGFRSIPRDEWDTDTVARWRVLRPRYPIVPASWNYTLEWASQYGAVRGLRDRLAPDLVHAHALLPDGFVGWKLARHYDVPLVLTWHGFYDFRGPYRALAREVLNYASAVLYVGTPLLRSIEKYTEITPKFRRLGNGSDGGSLPRSPRPESLASFARDRPVILSVGFLIERKGHRLMLEALRLLKSKGLSFAYVVAGDGPERGNLEQQVADADLRDDVLFLGNVEHDALWGYFDACDLFVLPSWDEAFGVVYAEALSRGRVVIGCEREGAADVAEAMGGTVLVPARDATALAAAIERFFADRAYREQLERSIKRDALSWRSVSDELSRLYEALAR